MMKKPRPEDYEYPTVGIDGVEIDGFEEDHYNADMELWRSKQFNEYCLRRKADFLPVKGEYYGFVLLTNGNIRIDKYSIGSITANKSQLSELSSDLKMLMDKDNFFVLGRKKAKNLTTLI